MDENSVHFGAKMLQGPNIHEWNGHYDCGTKCHDTLSFVCLIKRLGGVLSGHPLNKIIRFFIRFISTVIQFIRVVVHREKIPTHIPTYIFLDERCVLFTSFQGSSSICS